ncbi:hypothetical protein FRC12_010970, partial [Ceratobasidium sp. 428]
MVFHYQFTELKASISGLLRKIGRVKDFRRQCITLIQVCMDLQGHEEGHYDSLRQIIQEANEIIVALGDPEGFKNKNHSVNALFDACIQNIDNYERLYLASCQPSDGNLARCKHDYKVRLEEARGHDKHRESCATKIFQTPPRKTESGKKRPARFVLHSFAAEKPTLLS